MDTRTLFDLNGKIALVTGAVQGLGKSMATGLGQAGATIVFNGRNADKVEKARKEYEAKVSSHTVMFSMSPIPVKSMKQSTK